MRISIVRLRQTKTKGHGMFYKPYSRTTSCYGSKHMRISLILFTVVGLSFIMLFSTLTLTANASPVSTAKIGVVFSEQTEESGRQTTHPGSNMGQVAILEREELVYDMLKEKGYTVEKVSDATLKSTSALKKYKAVVFPYTFMMDEAQDVAVRDYVKDGGSIVCLFAPSRVYPPFALWIRYFKHLAWEWGPLSEVLQVQFINDPFDSGFSVSSKDSTHPIISRTKEALSVNAISLVEDRVSAVELTEALPGGVNKNVSPILWYKDGTAAAWAGRYGQGRVIYFTFRVMDFWWHARLKSQAAQAKELVANSVLWASESDGKAAKVDISAKTTGKITFSRSGLLVRHYHKGTGNVQAVGDVTTSIYNAKGKLVHQQKRAKAGAVPGKELYWSSNIKVSAERGTQYRVVITYQDRYKRFVHKEEATVTYGQSYVPTKPIATVETGRTFSDVAYNAWYDAFIKTLVERKILSGYTDGKFRPDASVTRAEFAKMICLAMGWSLEVPAGASFSDVDAAGWSYRYVETAVARGAIAGYPDGTFRPARGVTRAEVAAILARILNLPASSGSLTDISSHWAKSFISSCVRANIVSGYSDATFKPDNTATRAEAAKMVVGCMVEHAK